MLPLPVVMSSGRQVGWRRRGLLDWPPSQETGSYVMELVCLQDGRPCLRVMPGGVVGQSRRCRRLHFLDPFVGVVAFGEGCNLEPRSEERRVGKECRSR